MGEMSYRIRDEKEFYDIALKYVDDHISKFMKDLDTLDICKAKKSRIKHVYSEYVSTPSVNKLAKLKIGVAVAIEDIDNWKSTSCDINTSLDELMIRGIISNICQCDYVCTLFASNNHNLTEEFIDNYIYATSSLFRFDEWDDVHVNAVTRCAASGQTTDKCKELIELYGKDRLNSKTVSVRFDFAGIRLSDKSEEFISKYYTMTEKGCIIPKR